MRPSWRCLQYPCARTGTLISIDEGDFTTCIVNLGGGVICTQNAANCDKPTRYILYWREAQARQRRHVSRKYEVL